ncbi:hypothetical protein [Sphingomonas sp. KR3-1]
MDQAFIDFTEWSVGWVRRRHGLGAAWLAAIFCVVAVLPLCLVLALWLG